MDKKIVEGEVVKEEEDFTVDNVGRIVIVDNDELLEEVSGGVKEEKSSLFDPLLDEVSVSDIDDIPSGSNNNCRCSGNSGSGGPSAW